MTVNSIKLCTVVQGMDKKQAVAEFQRCLECDLRMKNNIKNDYINTMEQEKSNIINDIEIQLQQGVDETYQNAVDRMLKNTK